MNDIIEIKVPRIPGILDIILREGVLISLISTSADVRIETVYPAIKRIPPPPPRVTSSCERARTWTFSGSHMTGVNGTVEIHLNKFLDCIPAVIDGVINSNYIGSPPHFTATPESNEAVFVTCIITANGLQPPGGAGLFASSTRRSNQNQLLGTWRYADAEHRVQLDRYRESCKLDQLLASPLRI